MEIEARGKLQLQTIDDSIFLGNPRLTLVVKFKDPTKLFRKKVKLVSHLRVMGNNESMDSFLDRVEGALNSNITLEQRVEDEVRDYFRQKAYSSSTNERIKKLEKKVSATDSVTVKVKIK